MLCTALRYVGFSNSKSKLAHISLIELNVSYDLQHLAVTYQLAFNQQDLYLTPEFQHMMDCCSQALVSKLETLDTITLYPTDISCTLNKF